MTEFYPVRRVEVFTGAGHRRTWSGEAKAQILEESYSGLESVCAVARRHGLASTQLFTWRREARSPTAASPAAPLLAPVVIDPSMPEPVTVERTPARRRSRRSSDGAIELEIDGVTVRVERGAEAKTVAAVIKALKAAR